MSALPDSLIARAKDADLLALIGRSVKLQKAGRDFIGLCPFHEDHDPSLNVVPSKGFWWCPSCKASGDAISWLTRQGIAWRDAVQQLAGDAVLLNGHAHKPKPAQRSFRWMWPPPIEPPAQVHNPRSGKSTRLFRYLDRDGRLMHVVYRFDGKPKYLPYSFGEMTNDMGAVEARWHCHGPDEPKPLYGLQKLAGRDRDLIVLCEGEKKADAIGVLLPKFIGMSWSGGTGQVGKADWEPLRGRSVLIWRDNDEPGLKAEAVLLDTLFALGCTLARVDPTGMAKAWDAADALDEGWTPDAAMAWLKPRVAKWQPEQAREPEALPMLPDDPHDEQGAEDREAAQRKPHEPVPLGFDVRGGYYFRDVVTGMVWRKTSGELTERGLMDLAPLDTFWQDSGYCSDQRNGLVFNSRAAANWLMSSAKHKGVFNVDRRRGRGVWMDDGRWVVHLGDRLVVDGIPRKLVDIRSEYLYEPGDHIALDIDKPLSDREASEYVDLMRQLDFGEPWHADAVAGWNATALVSGAMRFRPHLFFDGPTGSGKGATMRNFMLPLASGLGVFVGLTTTAAAVRNMLGGDCVPVYFDEADSDSQSDRERVAEVLNLARGSSDEDGIKIGKAAPGGKTDTYLMRSPFCLAGTNNPVSRPADQNRFIVVTKRLPSDPGAWPRLRQAAADLLSHDYASRMFSRLINMLATIRANAETFADAISSVVSNRRSGNTMGTVLAGLLALRSSSLISTDDAAEFCSARGWVSTARSQARVAAADEDAVLSTLLEAKVRVQSHEGAFDMSIAELVRIWVEHQGHNGVYVDQAQDVLKRNGMLVYDQRLWVCHEHDWIRGLFRRSPFATSYVSIMRTRIEGVTEAQMRFHSGRRRSSIGVPIGLVIEEA